MLHEHKLGTLQRRRSGSAARLVVADHGDQPLVVGDCAGVEQIATLFGVGPADGIIGGEHDGLVAGPGRDDDQFAAVELAVAL